MQRMQIPSRELTAEDLELIEHAREIVDAQTDGEDAAFRCGDFWRRIVVHALDGTNEPDEAPVRHPMSA